MMPGNFPTCKIFDSQVKNDLKYDRKIQKYEIIAIIPDANGILHSHIDTEGINWFNE
jgi:hypothetical protein